MQSRSKLLVLVVSTWASFAAHAVSRPISISITTDSPIVKSGSDISIEIEMTNTSDHDLDCTKAYTGSGVDVRYNYDIKDATGKAVGKRARKHPEIGEAGSFYPCTLHLPSAKVLGLTQAASARY